MWDPSEKRKVTKIERSASQLITESPLVMKREEPALGGNNSPTPKQAADLEELRGLFPHW